MSVLIGIDIQQYPTGIIHESVRWETIATGLNEMGLPTAIAGFYLDGVRERMTSISEETIRLWIGDISKRLYPIAFLSSATTGPEWAAICQIGPVLKQAFPHARLLTCGPYAQDNVSGAEWERLDVSNPFEQIRGLYRSLIRKTDTDIAFAFSEALIKAFGPGHVIGATYTSNGCPFKCLFCLPQDFKAAHWNPRDEGEYLTEITLRKSLGYRFLRLIDLNITGGGCERFYDICEKLTRLFPDLSFWCDGSAEVLFKSNSTQLKSISINNWIIQLGIETFDPSSRKLLGRPPLEASSWSLIESLPLDTAVRLSLIPFFPWSTLPQITEVLEKVIHFAHLFPSDTLFRRLRLYSGLPITKTLQKERHDIPIDPFTIQYYPEETEAWHPKYFIDSQIAKIIPTWHTSNLDILVKMRQERGYRLNDGKSNNTRTNFLKRSAYSLIEHLKSAVIPTLSPALLDYCSTNFVNDDQTVTSALPSKGCRYTSIIVSNIL